MKSIIITSLLAAAAMATPDFKTTTKEPTPSPVICNFDPIKGEYVCPEGTNTADTLSHTSFHTRVDTEAPKRSSSIQADTPSAINTATADAPAADCAKCQADWEKCPTAGLRVTARWRTRIRSARSVLLGSVMLRCALRYGVREDGK